MEGKKGNLKKRGEEKKRDPKRTWFGRGVRRPSKKGPRLGKGGRKSPFVTKEESQTIKRNGGEDAVEQAFGDGLKKEGGSPRMGKRGPQGGIESRTLGKRLQTRTRTVFEQAKKG